MRDLLFEIGTEEIPAGFMESTFEQLKKGFRKKAAELKIEHGDIKAMGTPRRFALIVEGLSEKQPDITEELLGPSKKAAYDSDGNLTRAAQGFAKSKGAEVQDLKVVETPKGEYMMLVREVAGKNTDQLLPDILQSLILDLSFPKSMKWGANHLTFARPIQWLVALFGDEIIPLTHEGTTSSNLSGGHRFHANHMFEIKDAASYEQQLDDNQVIVDHEKRRKLVLKEIVAAVADTKELDGGKVLVDEELVDTVTNLVETPIGVCGTFDEKFLQLVPEVLITSMREHQKYFPVVNDSGVLLPGFVAVNNTKVKDLAVTRKGHQRVLRARLEDALFFYNGDRETKLGDRVEKLTGIIFQAKLGTMLEKKDRLVKLAKIISEHIDPSVTDDCCRAAELCKADLLSDMVGEFPSLQGIMGAAYAVHDGESEAVAVGIKEHYMPKRSGAAVPTTAVGAVLGLADRFDTLAGCFGIGQIPTGTADPFGLRRVTLAILHIIEDKGYDISLEEIVSKALALYGNKVDGSSATVEKIIDFMKSRFANDCVRKGIEQAAVAAAVSVGFDDVNDCVERMNAISKIHGEEAFGVLSASYKRVRNIIKDNRETSVDETLFEDDAERKLQQIYLEVKITMDKFIADKKYVLALEEMLKLKGPVDTFFDEVMVMAENEKIRQNRLNLLTALGELILMVGDISKFQE
jgi:glycyl-tRNA synthetase beta chain